MFVASLNNRIPLLQLARWQLGSAFVITALAATMMGGWQSLGQRQIAELSASGICGIVLASTTYFATIFLIGPRLTALLFSLTSPFALALGFATFGETITLWQALGSLFARPAMAAGTEPFAAMAVRLGIAVILFWAIAALPQVRGRDVRVHGREFGLIVTSAFFGTGLGMVLLMGALNSGNVGIVSTLSSMTPIVILPWFGCEPGSALPPPLGLERPSPSSAQR